MAGEYTLSIILKASNQTGSAVSEATGGLQGLAKSLSPITDIGLAVGAAVVGIGVASVAMAAQYQQSMNMVQALTGASKTQMDQYDAGIKQLAEDSGVAPQKLSQGLYYVISAGYQGADAMKVLTLSTRDAVIGMTDSQTTANALTTVMKSFGVSVAQADAVNGEMLKTVTLGKMTMADYAGSIGKASSTTMQYHESMETMNASLATLTSNGVPSAAQAVTDYDQALKVMDGNIGTVSASLNKQGIAFNEAKFNTLDYAGKITMLSGALQKANSEHKTVTGVTEQAAQAIQILSQHSQEYTKDLQSLSNQQSNANATQSAWATTQAGFSQTMNRLNATLQVAGITIGQALLPALTNVAQSLIPLVQGFTQWVTTSGTLQAVASGLGTTLSVLGNVLSTITSFFEHNKVALDALKIVLIAVAGAILASMVVSLYAWAAAAISAAVGMLALTWPVLLIGAIIALVVAGIILAVQHWGEITKWFQGLWGGFSIWFMGIVKSVGDFFTGVWHSVANFFTSVWNGIVAGMRAAWNAIVNVVKIGIEVVLAVLFAPIIAIAALFIWLYNHNTYFKQLVDTIVNFFKVCFTWLQGSWTDVINWLVGAWNNVVGFATALWTKVSETIKAGFYAAIAYVQAIWNTISSFFVNAWNNYIANPLHTLWTNVSNVFSSAWNTYIAGPLGGIWNAISKWFTDLGTSAMNSGKNFINMLVQGIVSGTGAIWNAVVGIASTIWKALGFHSPAKEGPASDADTWMPNLMKMFSQGIDKGIPQVQSSVNKVAQTLSALATTSPALAVAGPIASPISQTTSSNSNNNIAIHVHLNGGSGANAQKQGKDIAAVVKRELARDLRQQSISPRFTSGGTHQ